MSSMFLFVVPAPSSSVRGKETRRHMSHVWGQHQGSCATHPSISFHSISKGFLGECGLRGGYFELNCIDSKVADEIYKMSSISLCSNTVGQVAVGLMVRPPKQGEPSFETFNEEKK